MLKAELLAPRPDPLEPRPEQVERGAYLGKVLLRTGGASAPKWNLVAYFALEPPA